VNADQNTTPIPSAIVDTATEWYVRQSSGLMSGDEQARLVLWLAEHPEHARAWQRMQEMAGHLHAAVPRLAPGITRSVLKRLPALERRKTLRLLSWAMVGGGSLFLGRDLLNETAFPADHSTATGERREILLADGTLLQLNTNSAVDIRFDEAGRCVRLRRGEIHIVTALDPANRPFWVEARDGRLLPVGTRFAVTQLADSTLLGVSQGAVDVLRAGHGNTLRVTAGQQLSFGGPAVERLQALDEFRQAWTQGMISAENRRVDDLLAELSRHRKGRLHCTPQAGELRVTGTWPLRGSDPAEAILTSLERHLPIRVQRLTRYWVTVETR